VKGSGRAVHYLKSVEGEPPAALQAAE